MQHENGNPRYFSQIGPTDMEGLLLIAHPSVLHIQVLVPIFHTQR